MGRIYQFLVVIRSLPSALRNRAF